MNIKFAYQITYYTLENENSFSLIHATYELGFGEFTPIVNRKKALIYYQKILNKVENLQAVYGKKTIELRLEVWQSNRQLENILLISYKMIEEEIIAAQVQEKQLYEKYKIDFEIL